MNAAVMRVLTAANADDPRLMVEQIVETLAEYDDPIDFVQELVTTLSGVLGMYAAAVGLDRQQAIQLLGSAVATVEDQQEGDR